MNLATLQANEFLSSYVVVFLLCWQVGLALALSRLSTRVPWQNFISIKGIEPEENSGRVTVGLSFTNYH
jgi:hypothetical protein